ncbi:hypothetical protein QBC45DRAFT_408896 [Copromyces sp. CBS 386.78]|nr:hypothetical protein QBC45DRAFT_408896 [Copromyces sp. CBS 386.78]
MGHEVFGRHSFTNSSDPNWVPEPGARGTFSILFRVSRHSRLMCLDGHTLECACIQGACLEAADAEDF